MAYTYDQFLTELNNSGLQNQFSSYDLATAQQYPDFGMSMIALKKDYANAQTDQARALANSAAEQLRSSYGNYMGGSSGSSYINLGRTPGDYQSRYGSAIDDAISALNNYGSFSYADAPTYESRYDERMNSLLDEITNRQPYLYNYETDPVWQAYKKQHTREGKRATEDTLANYAAMTGGMPSSYAVNAATQAGDYYAAQMTDMIPQLYQDAYERYLNEYNMKQNDLAAVQSMENMDYSKYQDQLAQYNTDRNLAYNQWQDLYNMAANNLGIMQDQDDREYNRYLTDLDWNQTITQNRLDQNAAAQEAAANEVDAILATGATPSAALVGQSGYNQEYIDAMANYYAQQAALEAAGSYTGSGSSGSGSSGSKGNSSSDDETSSAAESIFQQIKASGMGPVEYLTVNGYNASQTKMLAAEYNSWLESEQKPSATGSGGTASANDKANVINNVHIAASSGRPAAAADALLAAGESGVLTEAEVLQIAGSLGLTNYILG